MLIKDSVSGQMLPVQANPVTGVVGIYACGITPYSPSHVGHARTYVVFDLLERTLQAEGHSVRLVRNITDIDDKIIAAAQREGKPWHEVSNFYAELNRQLMKRTGLRVPEEPKASDFLTDIFDMVDQLIALDLAYVAPNNDVLYRVAAFKPKQVLMNHQEGALRSEQGHTRVDASHKEDNRDFVLWKSMPEDAVGFPSPWGWGRPGWHVECSAMITALFGGYVSIHGGGVDLKFPHHHCEILQSEPLIDRPLADIWMHNGSVLSNGRKMSKSEGNFVTWEDALAQADAKAPGLGGELLAYALLQAHWQKPLDWSAQLLETSSQELYALAAGLDQVRAGDTSEIIAMLAANLNTPAVVVWLRKLRADGHLATLKAALQFLGVTPDSWAVRPKESIPENTAYVQELQDRRLQARAAKDWVLADQLRDELAAMGINTTDKSIRQ